MKLLNELKSVLKKDERLISDDELLKNKIVELALKLDEDLIKLLKSNKKIKEHFFKKVDDVLVFDKEKFMKFVDNKEFLPDSYTAFKNKIGLTSDKEYLAKNKEVVLSWPYKDCVLEGGQEKEDEKRKEIFHNEILAPDEIDRLLDPKVFTNFKRIDAKGEHKAKEIKSDDNLIIKGNNLLALHSLKKKYAGKVKLIYIDPPYNPDSNANTFNYNNTFNESTWLTFMKNRLEIAKKFLASDGVLIIAIDENELFQLGQLLIEIYDEYEIHCVTIVHNPRGVQGSNFSYVHEYAIFVIPKGQKTICNREIKEDEIEWSNFRNWGGESLRENARNCFYPIIIDKNNNIVGFGDVLDSEEHPEDQTEEKNGQYYVWPIDTNNIERKWRYSRQSVEDVKHLLRPKRTVRGFEIEIGKDFGTYKTVWIDPKYDANEYGTKIVSSLVPENRFSFPKSLWNVYDCLHSVVSNDKDAIVLDFFAGSGTTAHALLELNKNDGGHRKFILCEQMDYVDTITTERIKKVIEQNNRGSFIYMKLMEWNESYMDKIQEAETSEELLEIWNDMKKNAFLSYKVDEKLFDENMDDFKKLDLEEQKKLLLECLDHNNLYVNYSEIDDKQYKISNEDKELNKKFYGGL